MNERHIYTTISAIQEKLDISWESHGRKITFVDAVHELYYEGKLVYEKKTPVDYYQWTDGDPYTLRKLYGGYYLDVTDIVNDPGIYTSLLPESLSFYEQDVWPMFLLRNEAAHIHSTECFEILYVMSGKCILTTNNERRVLENGSFCILTPGVAYDTSAEGSSVVLDILIKSSTLETAFATILGTDSILADFFKNSLYGSLMNFMLFTAPMTPAIADLIRSILIESDSSQEYSKEVCNHYMGIFLAEILRTYSATYTHHSTKRSINTQMPLVLAYIKNNYQDLSLRKLADHFGYDTDYLGKLILKSTGKYFNDILNSYRTDRAEILLLYTEKTLSEISEECGYNSTDHFSRTFRKFKGQTPGKFRKYSTKQNH